MWQLRYYERKEKNLIRAGLWYRALQGSISWYKCYWSRDWLSAVQVQRTDFTRPPRGFRTEMPDHNN